MGCHSVPQIMDYANQILGLRMKQTKKRPFRPLTLSSTYNMFRNVFYTGNFDYDGQRYPGKHDAMITLDEYLRVQDILDGTNVNSGSQKHEHAFTVFM